MFGLYFDVTLKLSIFVAEFKIFLKPSIEGDVKNELTSFKNASDSELVVASPCKNGHDPTS